MKNRMTLSGKGISFPASVFLIVVVAIVLYPLSILCAPPDVAVPNDIDQKGLPTKQPQGKEVTVPKVEGMTLDHARLTLEKAGLRFKLADQPTSVKTQSLVGKVATQNPAARSRVKFGSAVVVSPYVLETSKSKQK
jgi:hypothetical protein